MRKGTGRKNRARWIYFFSGIGLGTAFGLYLWSLYGQLTSAFNQEEQFNPTRIYSDVTRISLAQPRSRIEDRLKTLAYHFTSNDTAIQFQLHRIDYPLYLLPDNHPQIDAQEPPIALQFDHPGATGLLHSIQAGGHELQDLFLEPELVATLSHNGNLKKEIRTSLKFDEIPASVWKAIIAIEDQHFLEHKGLDPKGIARAIWVNFRTLSLAQGGSTITQQLVKNLMARKTKNIFRKANELFLALLLEAKFDKEQILERYLNEVYLGQVGSLEVHGVAEGAEHFFGKKLEDLNLAETALMAGLIRGPGYYSPYRYRERAVERQKLVLKKMVETGQIAEAEAQAALLLPIRLAPPQNTSTKAPFFTDYVKAELVRLLGKKNLTEQEITRLGFRVYTTLDTSLNLAAQKSVAEGISQLESRFKLSGDERLEGALASVDPSTGHIRALVGGKSYSQSNFNRILNMKRQVGSTFKPLVYLAAFQKGEDPKGITYGPGHPAEDSEWTLTFDHGKQTWSPKNYEKEYLGWISFRTALAHSVNTVAAKLGHEIGVESIIQCAKALGIESDLPAVPSLSLGVAELSPIELLKVYATLANRGQQDDLTVIRGITQQDGTGYARFVYHPKQVFDSGSIDLLTDVLQSVFTDGTARAALKMGFNHIAAGKTGTTSNHRDAWFAGYTPQLATVVWTGLDQYSEKNSSIKLTLTGANSALPIWVDFMNTALAGEPPIPFPASPLLADVRIDRHTGKEADSSCPASQVIVEKYTQAHMPRGKSCEPLWPEPGPKKVSN